MTYEQLDRSIDADSDSEDDLAEQAHLYRSKLSISCDCFSCPLLTKDSGDRKADPGNVTDESVESCVGHGPS